jgi:peroxiredoxin Q/BCP
MMLNVGDVAPDFELLNQDGQPVRLSDFRGQRVVIFTFPKAGTMGCTIQARSFRDEFLHITAANVTVLGLSADSPEELKAWKERENLPYDLLSDPEHSILEAWGVWGMKLVIFKFKMAQRTSWVIDENGVIVDKQVPVGPKASVQKALDALDKLPQSASSNAR